MWRFAGLFFCSVIVLVPVRGENEFVPTNYEILTTPTMGSFGAQERCGEGEGKGLLHCVPYHRCDPETNTTIPEEQEAPEIDYSTLIDIRLGEDSPCTEILHVCCPIGNHGTSPMPPTPTGPTPPTPSPTPTPAPPEPTPDHKPPPSRLSQCGIRNINGVGFKITGNTHNEAEYGEFPWMVAILKTNYNPSVDPVLAECGGSLIAPRVVLTGAHCVGKFNPEDLKVRAGEWETQSQNERYPYQERNVKEIIIHEKFDDKHLFNDVALLVLEKPFSKARHIGTVCLPEQDEEVVSKECYATGWGKDLFGREGQFQVILKKIDLPIVPRKECEAALRDTRLGHNFELDASFVCAGGVPGKDTCTGDGGSPLVCPDPKNPGRYVQVGIVAWGIGCGTEVPGVYADVAKFRNWVDQTMQRLNLSNKPYVA
ncbi:phenoloxidase-activating factor 2-like isoform X2 [Zophobas morio]|uniref:phenoloxidase-activating factor 2-like isoform X2 n=1 Tax=Zophobas morio TaxID=2755281 RepID=UPI003082C7D2